MAIPKIIHICWFGGAALEEVNKKCLKSIYALESQGYEIRLWTDDNYCMEKSEILRKAYKNKQWSLVSNYARLDILAEFGGIYLDSDIEVIRNFDDLLENDLFIGFMWDSTLGTAVIGSQPGNRVIRDILNAYEIDPSSFKSPNNNTFTDYFVSSVPTFKLDGSCQQIGKIHISRKYAFEHPTISNRSNYTVHHFQQTWKNASKIKYNAKKLAINLLSLWLYRKYVCWNSLRKSPYLPLYLATRRNAYRRSDNQTRFYSPARFYSLAKSALTMK